MNPPELTTHVVGPGWVDPNVNRIRGLFPLSVERYLNEAIGTFAPSVTTVTNVSRSYPLHGLVMADATDRDLDSEQTRHLLRRAEVVLALASIAHTTATDHPSWFPAAHGAEKLINAWTQGPIDIDQASGDGDLSYSSDRWGFLNPYLGSEVRLGILGDPSSQPGPGFVEHAVRPALNDVLTLARQWRTVTRADAGQAAHLCICRARSSSDGQWLAGRLAGDTTKPGTIAGTIAATMQLLARLISAHPMRTEHDIADQIRYSPLLHDEPDLANSAVAQRWRGITLRHSAIVGWRTLWDRISRRAFEDGGFVPIHDLQDWLADQAPTLTVGQFINTLPATMNGAQPADAERHIDKQLSDPIRALATVLLSGRRAHELTGNANWGYLGEPTSTDRAQELSPLWVAHAVQRWHNNPLPNFCSHLVKVLLDRSQRVALDKAGYRRGQYVLPARVLVRDGFVEWRDREGAAAPPLRLERMIHIGRQVDLFSNDDEGNWVIGSRGDLLAR